jgi:hypothetical protein
VLGFLKRSARNVVRHIASITDAQNPAWLACTYRCVQSLERIRVHQYGPLSSRTRTDPPVCRPGPGPTHHIFFINLLAHLSNQGEIHRSGRHQYLPSLISHCGVGVGGRTTKIRQKLQKLMIEEKLRGDRSKGGAAKVKTTPVG